VDTEDAIVAVVQRIIEAWNRHDMDAFAKLFTDDADFVNVRGMRWIGRHAIREAHAASHATIFKNSQLGLRESSVRFLRPDIAVARSVTEVTGQINASGETSPPRSAMLTLVMVNVENKWMIAVAQNTDIVPTSR
jgi:uncharacterized protein (TIGR02246 family)